MATRVVGMLKDDLKNAITQSKVLVVGAGGIGCELLKNLVLSGFEDLEVIDLDTIDVSNLNRQFLFRKEHVGKSKSLVAKESALRFNEHANIVAIHDSIFNPDYGKNFIKRFTIVMNALDNRAARNHVNRLCLAADVPLVESGSAGYLGQVTVIKKGETECYECQPKPTQKTFPGCTIRNTPSEPIHCIVWAKHLFNQLFGEDDPDQDVSPDTADPEAAGNWVIIENPHNRQHALGDAGANALGTEAKTNVVGGVERKSTKLWAGEIAYDTEKLFNKFFHDDVKYLLSMANLWKKRRAPTPLVWSDLPEDGQESNSSVMRDQQMWSIRECARVLSRSLNALSEQLKQGDGDLVWDKDDEDAMDFVTAAANVRAHIFGISTKSRFDIKSMAGNIIPAIATTNAIIAGLIVLEAIKVLTGNLKKCRTMYLNRRPNNRHRLLVPSVLDPPNPKCYVCASKPELSVRLNTELVTVGTLQEKILKKELGMVAPDGNISGTGTILISSDPDDDFSDNLVKPLSHFGVKDGSSLDCDDFLQEYSLRVNIIHSEKLEDDVEYEIVGDVGEVKNSATSEQEHPVTSDDPHQTNTKQEGASNTVDSDDDLVMLSDEDDVTSGLTNNALKRKISCEGDGSSAKRPRPCDPEGSILID